MDSNKFEENWKIKVCVKWWSRGRVWGLNLVSNWIVERFLDPVSLMDEWINEKLVLPYRNVLWKFVESNFRPIPMENVSNDWVSASSPSTIRFFILLNSIRLRYEQISSNKKSRRSNPSTSQVCRDFLWRHSLIHLIMYLAFSFNEVF